MGFLQAGDYVLKKNLSIIQVMDVLTQGKILQSKITIPEGWTNKQIEDEVVKKGIGSKKDFENDLAGSHEFKFLKESPNGSLEGFLFPDTYLLSSKPTSKELIQKMLSEFGQKADPKIMAKASETGLSYYQVLVLSSIVEREVISKEDRRKVAGVFLNRLKNDMKLDSDATVEFVLNSNKRILSDTDIAVDSPYNTYKNKGLPPGPIGNPGIESIESVLTFEKNDYLYFFSGKDGKTYFSKTQEEHEEKKAKYL